MAGLRPSKCYKHMKGMAYTRTSRNPSLAYIRGVPQHRVAQFVMGTKSEDLKAPFVVSLYATYQVQIRHNALESGRMAAQQFLSKSCPQGYKFMVLTYPHNVMRENVLAKGAGADRYKQGMGEGYGTPIGLAARIKSHQKIMAVWCFESDIPAAKEALKRASSKLPVACKLIVEDIRHKKHMGSIVRFPKAPKKARKGKTYAKPAEKASKPAEKK